MKLSNQSRLKKIPNATFLRLAIPLLFLFQITLPGIVLCFGTDGHIALEKSNTGSCCECISNSDNITRSISKTKNYSETGHCGTCVDIRISDNNTDTKIKSSNNLIPEIDLHTFADYILPPLWSQEDSGNRLTIQELPAGNTLLDSLQTTILIC